MVRGIWQRAVDPQFCQIAQGIHAPAAKLYRCGGDEFAVFPRHADAGVPRQALQEWEDRETVYAVYGQCHPARLCAGVFL